MPVEFVRVNLRVLSHDLATDTLSVRVIANFRSDPNAPPSSASYTIANGHIIRGVDSIKTHSGVTIPHILQALRDACCVCEVPKTIADAAIAAFETQLNAYLHQREGAGSHA